MTVTRARGQTLGRVSVSLEEPVFSHEQTDVRGPTNGKLTCAHVIGAGLGDLPSSSIHYDLSECTPIYSMTYYGKIYDKTPVVVRQCPDPPVYFQPSRSAGVGHPRQMSAIQACLRRAWRADSPNGRLCRHQSAASSTHRVLLGAGWPPCLPSGHGGLCTT